MLLNVAQLKKLAKDYDKQVSKDYIIRLDDIIKERVLKSVRNGKGFKRLKASELL